MFLSFLMGFFIERGIIRWVENSSPLTLLIITLGSLAIMTNGAGWRWGFLPKRSQSPFPAEPVKVGDVVLSWQTIGIVLVLIVVMLLVFGAVQVHEARPRTARRRRQPAVGQARRDQRRPRCSGSAGASPPSSAPPPA